MFSYIDNKKNEQSKETLSQKEIFQQATWKNKTLSSFSLAGLATNLKDGVAWGLFPLYFTSLRSQPSPTRKWVLDYSLYISRRSGYPSHKRG
ncbi:hypothetical protein [Anoxybacillus sp. KU2-6(11)]|uniref:hypothetical protein n=1 Tax=Anoxybacillus sp. KU2-6(11) TaxID=1535751 RepID=UPI00068EA5FD|nr:hypothetical protein [Anoxybacillus sp. KU2-6(11)]